MKKVLFIHLFLRLLVSFDIFMLTDGCRNDQFECSTTHCIDITLRCNNNFDCPDNSDELNCSTIGVCPEGLYYCDSGQCINAGLCDGINNCADGTDERNCGGITLYDNMSESSSNHNSVFMSSTPYPSKTILSIISTTTYTVKPLETSSSSMDLPTIENSVASPTTPSVSNNKTNPISDYTPDDRGTNDIIVPVPVAIVVSLALMLLMAAIVASVYRKRRNSRKQRNLKFGKRNTEFQSDTQNNTNVTTI